MSWFEEQISERLKRDNATMRNANYGLTSAILGKDMNNKRLIGSSNASDEIASYYNVKSIDELVKRDIQLTDEWYADALGAMIGQTNDGEEIALIPNKYGGYAYFDAKSGKRLRVKKSSPIQRGAICFYRQLPDKALHLRDLINFILKSISKHDIIKYLLCMFVVSLLGVFLPYINQQIFSVVIPKEDFTLLISISIMFLCVLVATSIVKICASLAVTRIEIKTEVAISPAVYMRVLSLPVTFFKEYSSGELMERASAIKTMVQILFSSVASTAISFIFSLIYVAQIQSIAPMMSKYAIILLLLFLILSLSSTAISLKMTRKNMNTQAKLSGFLFHLLSGMQKIKLTGSEKRMYAKWAGIYAQKAKNQYNPPLLMKISAPLNVGLTFLGTIIFFFIGATNHITTANYMAFSIAYGMLCSAVLSLGNIIQSIAQLKPNLEMAKPIMETIPESYTNKIKLSAIVSSIEVSHINFRYKKDTPFIYKDFSLKIRRGEYIGIVGKTGCGKSTLIRLLMGFETPQKGAIFYNGINMNELDLKTLRRKMGIVMQTSTVFPGTIFSNIATCNPEMTQEEAWEIARIVGLEDDIQNMPMGMHTLISEGGGCLSGGQRQRIIIARAIASKPDILIFDEATSALDNITQKQVSDSLDSLKCTRIVIAHRLSTIKNCSRIIVIDNGSIIEDGTFQELLDKQGYFAELVKRQLT